MADPGDALVREAVFTALTRPQMFAGVTYNFFIVNALLTMEIFLVTKSFWVILVALGLHAIGSLVCLREPRVFDLWALRAQRSPRLANFRDWQCNSFDP